MRGPLGALCTIAIVGCGLSRHLGPIQLIPLATLGATSGPGVIANDPVVSAGLRSGVRVLIPAGTGGETTPLVYAGDGRFLGTLEATTDSASGFRRPVFTRVGPGDSLWVFDAADRVLVFGPGRNYVRTVPLPVSPWDAVILRDGRLLVTSSDAGHPLPALLLDATGQVVREIGSADSAALAIKAPRHIMIGPDGTWWTMPTAFRWQFEHWDTTGAAIGVLAEPAPGWFLPYDTLHSGSVSQSPSPMLVDAWFDDVGRLWVVGQVADRHWSRGFAPSHDATADAVAVITDPDRAFDTMMQIVDPVTDKELAETRLDASYTSGVEPGVLLRVLNTRSGWKQAQLIRVKLDTAAASQLVRASAVN